MHSCQRETLHEIDADKLIEPYPQQAERELVVNIQMAARRNIEMMEMCKRDELLDTHHTRITADLSDPG